MDLEVPVCITHYLGRASLHQFRTQTTLTPPSRAHGLAEHVEVMQIQGKGKIVVIEIERWVWPVKLRWVG